MNLNSIHIHQEVFHRFPHNHLKIAYNISIHLNLVLLNNLNNFFHLNHYKRFVYNYCFSKYMHHYIHNMLVIIIINNQSNLNIFINLYPSNIVIQMNFQIHYNLIHFYNYHMQYILMYKYQVLNLIYILNLLMNIIN